MFRTIILEIQVLLSSFDFIRIEYQVQLNKGIT